MAAALRPAPNEVTAFEQELAAHFEMRHALLFPYGRSAIHSCLRALNRAAGGEVVQPAYSCVVVAHATTLAGCRPVFVDAEPGSPNQDAEAMVEQVNERTVAVVPTSIFGLAFDAPSLCEGIRRRNSKAFIVMDCSLCFDARWHGNFLATQADATVLAFGIGKPMTTLYGGALMTNRDDVAAAVQQYREASFRVRPPWATALRWAYFLSSWVAFSGPMVGLTDLLEHADTPVRRYLVKRRSRSVIGLPADNQVLMTRTEAAVGRSQLKRVTAFMQRRREIGARYDRELADLPGLRLLDWPEGSSCAIYAARVAQPSMRAAVLEALHREGVQGDAMFNYVIPGLQCYRDQGYGTASFPNAQAWSDSVINLPNHPTMTDGQVRRVIQAVRRAFGDPSTRNAL